MSLEGHTLKAISMANIREKRIKESRNNSLSGLGRPDRSRLNRIG